MLVHKRYIEGLLKVIVHESIATIAAKYPLPKHQASVGHLIIIVDDRKVYFVLYLAKNWGGHRSYCKVIVFPEMSNSVSMENISCLSIDLLKRVNSDYRLLFS